MSEYRIIKRKNAIHKDVEEFVLQRKSRYYHGELPSLGLYSPPRTPTITWTCLEIFATLEAAQERKYFLVTGLNPGEEIVG